jgi:hypothetical protein
MRTVQTTLELEEILNKQTVFSAKTVVPVKTLKEINRWLKDNCSLRWSATDYKGFGFNWRKLSKMRETASFYEMDITIIVTFKKREDLMLYMLTWPSELLLNE